MTVRAWQSIIREEKQREYENGYQIWRGVDADLKHASVRSTSRAIAEKIIYEYEWLGTLPPAGLYHGLFFGDICGGVLCYGIGTTGPGANSTAKMYGLQQKDFAYLMRGACTHWTPKNSASFLIGRSLKMLPEAVKVVIAYSDTDAGEYGTVYQASNWLCLGRGKNTLVQLVSPNGAVRDQMFINDQAKKNGVPIPYMRNYLLQNGWIMQKKNPKYRYCYILATGDERKRIISKIKALIQPYPKRTTVNYHDSTR